MNPDHARFAQWDAAYVLGALSSAERSEYEGHIAFCEECRRAISELSPLPGLLARLSNERAATLLDPDADAGDATAPGPSADLVDGVLRRNDERRRGIRGIARPRLWVALGAAAAILVGAIVVPLTLNRPATDEQSIALQSIADLPITAHVTLTPVGWGTRLQLECRYEGEASSDTPEGGWPYTLFVVDEDGERTEVSSWRAAPGATARLEAGTAVDLEEIAAIEIGSGNGETLMRGAPSESR